jgi:hypothetical protein
MITTKRLGLAAYIKMNGGVLLEIRDSKFCFETDKTEGEWEIEYSNSCCYQHDSELVNLRNLLNKIKGK